MPVTPDLAVHDLPLAGLSEWPRNPRRISRPRLEQLKRALAAEPEMLRARPLIALPDGTVVAGNQRLRAARELGWPSLPVVTVDLDAARAQEWALRDNQGYGEDDEQAVGALLAELAAAGRDLNLSGYGSAEVDRLLALARPVPPVDPDEAPPVPAVPKSVRGEVYELGAHRLMCGDALHSEMPSGVIITDPPYGVDYEYESWDASDAATNDALYAWLNALAHPVVYFCGSVNLKRELDRGPAKVAIWHKPWSMTHSGIGNGRHHWEPILIRRAEGAYLASDVLVVNTDRVPGLREGHSCPKPVDLIAQLVSAFARERETLVVDPFAGSGTTLIVCEQAGRACFVAELDEGYCDVIRQRYADYTGQPQLAP